MWTVEGGTTLTPAAPVTLTWDNGQGLVFRRTIAIDDNYMFTVADEVENKTDARRRAAALRAHLSLRHAEDDRLLHPARGPDRRGRASRACRRSPTPTR